MKKKVNKSHYRIQKKTLKNSPVYHEEAVSCQPQISISQTEKEALENKIRELLEENDSLRNSCSARDLQIKRLTSRIAALQNLEISVLCQDAEINQLKNKEKALCEKEVQLRQLQVQLENFFSNTENISSLEVNGQEPESTVSDSIDETALVSVVLPIYNQADMAVESIESILAQTYKHWELIIVNDGSTDNLDETVAPYLADSRIHYLKQPNQRLPKALSNGFSFAQGFFLTWTSADNRMHPRMLEKLVAFLLANPQCAMVYADYMTIDENGEPLHADWFRPQNKLSADSAELYLPHSTELLNLIQDNFIGASFMYRRSARQLIGDYDPQLGIEDYDYWMRINSMMKISHLGTHDILYSYRLHNNSLSAKAKELQIEEKGMGLMEYEKERHAFYFKNFNVYGKYQASDLYFGDFVYKFHPEPYQGDDIPSVFAKRILISKGSDLYQYSPEELKKYNFISTFFYPGEANEVGKNAWRIRKFNIQCFAFPNSQEAARLHILTDNCIECFPGELGYLTLVAANNRMFFEATHSQEEIRRELPATLQVNDGKIIILLDGIGNGGMEQVAYDMVNSFRKNGKNVILVSKNAPQSDVKLPEGISVYTLSTEDPEKDYRTLLTAEKTEAVIAHYCTWGAKIAHELQVPYFQVIHNTYVWFGEKEIQEYTDADPCTAGYIAVSAAVAWYAMECLRLPAEKMIVIENGVDFDKFTHDEKSRKTLRSKLGFTDEHFVFLNPASVYGTKGQTNLIRAFAQAHAQNPNLRLLMAGKIMEPQYYEEVQRLIEELDLKDAVISGCFFDNMAEVYSAADAVVLASFWEGCSLAVAEAVHMRKPLLSAVIGDIERQTDYNNCVLFDLPFRYLTEMTGANCGAVVYTPNQHITERLAEGMLKIVNKDYTEQSPDTQVPELPADEVYQRYLKVLNYYTGHLDIMAFRHNI